MPPARPRLSLEARLAALDAWTGSPDAAGREAELRKALRGAPSLLAARAARIAGETGCCGLLADLTEAFERFLRDPVKTDKGCAAKLAIAGALNALDLDAGETFLLGIRHVQMEPAWGPPVDAADLLRAECAFGLVRIQSPRVLPELADLLHDPETGARKAAVRAVGGVGGEAAEMMLRMKALSGDPEAEITGECLGVLLEIAPERSLSFAARFLHGEDRWLGRQAALILGQSRHPGAFAVLRAHWDASPTSAERRGLLLPFGLLRSEEAFEFLLGIVEEGHETLAAAAAEGVQLCLDSAPRLAALGRALARRPESAVCEAFRGVLAGGAGHPD